MLDNMAIFNGMTQKMDFLQVRQRVLSQNITNSDTPDYIPNDVKNPNFRSTLGRYMERYTLSQGDKVAVASTNQAHMTHRQLLDRAETGDPMRQTYEIAPAENGVTLEEQMINASKTAVDYQLVTNLYNKNLDILRSAIR